MDSTAQHEGLFRAVTWNLWAQQGPWNAREEAIAATLAEIAPDIAGLQEVWRSDRSQAEVLAAQLDMHATFHPVSAKDGVEIGNAILSRWPIVETNAVDLLPPPDGTKRVALHARVDAPFGAFDVYCTHLSWEPHHSKARQGQVIALAEFIEATSPPRSNSLVLADLNSPPSSDEVRMLTGNTAVPVEGLVFQDAWALAGDGSDGFTTSDTNVYADDWPWVPQRIDYVLCGIREGRPLFRVRRCALGGVEPVNGTIASDHYAVIADLDLWQGPLHP